MLFRIVGAALLLALTPRILAQAAPPTQQIGPGSTASITHQGTGTAADKPRRLLDGALTPATRQTLQKAMDSTSDK